MCFHSPVASSLAKGFESAAPAWLAQAQPCMFNPCKSCPSVVKNCLSSLGCGSKNDFAYHQSHEITLSRYTKLMLFEHPLNFVMVANFKENQFPLGGVRLKKQPQPKTCTAFEKIRTKFPDASPPVLVRSTPCIQHGHQCFIHCPAILEWKFSELPNAALSQLELPRGLQGFR
jgi:hypothetical protein